MAATTQGTECSKRFRVSRRPLVLAVVVAAALSLAAFGTIPVLAAGRAQVAAGPAPVEPPSPKDRLMGHLTSHSGTSVAAPRVSSPSISCNSTWNVVSSPNSGTGTNVLGSISGAAANDVWAVGYFVNGSAVAQTLAEHWNGSAWSIVATPNTGAGDNLLESVVAIGPSDAWAVGYSRPDNSSSRQSLTEHWNGTAWSVVTNPQVASASNSLFAVAAGASNDVWAVGRSSTSTVTQISGTTLAMHWNGTLWSLVTATPSVATNTSELVGVKFVSSTNVWAVGDQQNFTGTFAFPSTALIEHWNGTSWSQATQATDNANGDFLSDVAGTATDLWAVGGQYASTTTDAVLTEHSTNGGTTWTAVAGVTPDLSANLFSLAYISGTNVYAAGASAYLAPSTSSELDHTLIERWNGSAWAQVTSPNASTNDDLFVVAAITADDVWADGVSASQTLTENFCISPAVTSVVPNTGPAVGGTSVVITGSGFTGAVGVSFGTTPAASFHVDSDTQITAASPAHPGGLVDITVTVQGTSATSSADQFTYVAPVPVVSSISPTSGPTKGGPSVTITGTGLLFATSVKFGTVGAASITSNSDTQIVAVSPAEAQSTVDVTVTTAGGTSATSTADHYMFVAPVPVVTAINPTAGSPAGGTSVTITGTGLSFATAVAFGSTPASSITSNTDTQIVAVSPAGTVGTTVHVTVTTAGGTSATSAADQFTFGNPCPTGLSGRARVADFNGDGKADIGFLPNTNSCVRLSTGSAFGTNTIWQSSPFYGTITTLTGDVNGDGKADVIAVNNGSTWVMLASGGGFGSPTQWSNQPFYGTIGTFVADVNGDGRADLVAVNNTSVWVLLSTGSSFGPPTQWSNTPFYGNVATLVGDVSGDGKADLIALNSTSTWVLTSTGSGFNSPAQWSNTAFYGNVTTLVGDVNGDGKADLIAVNNSSTWVFISTGTVFGSPAMWSNTPFYGTQATLVGDVNGDGKVDVIAVNGSSLWVMTSSGSAYSSPAFWG
jgi:hypothetical protein